MPSKYKALNDATRLAHSDLTGRSPNPEHQQWAIPKWIEGKDIFQILRRAANARKIKNQLHELEYHGLIRRDWDGRYWIES